MIGEIGAPSVQRSTARLLSKIFRMAVRERVIPSSPCEARFSYSPKRKRPKTLVDTLSLGEFLAAIEGIKYEPAILAMLGGGLRLEEAVVLRWEGIEPWAFRGVTYAVVPVERTIVSAKGGKLLQDGTKTDLSRREMVIGDPFATRLLALKELRGPGTAGALGPRSRRHGRRAHLADDHVAQLAGVVRQARCRVREARGHPHLLEHHARRGWQPRLAGLHGHGALRRDHPGQSLPPLHKASSGHDCGLPAGCHRERRRRSGISRGLNRAISVRSLPAFARFWPVFTHFDGFGHKKGQDSFHTLTW